MKTVGFPISDKEQERRRALLPRDIGRIHHPDALYIENGYGNVLGIADEAYEVCGCHLCGHEDVLGRDVICDPKIGDAAYLSRLSEQTLFGWVHAVRNRNAADCLVDKHLTAFAWEEMFTGPRHCFARNNEIAGEAAIFHAFEQYGLFPYDAKVALIGRGNVARGAMKILMKLGAEVTVYTRKEEALFRREVPKYQVIVNAIKWDTRRSDHILGKKDLKRMRPHSLIIDISCDRHGAIETSEPTSITDPVYTVDGIEHYVVDHTPAIFFRSASIGISKTVSQYLDQLVEDRIPQGSVLAKAMIADHGVLKDEEIVRFQHRRQV